MHQSTCKLPIIFSFRRSLSVTVAVCLAIGCNSKAPTLKQQDDQRLTDGSKEEKDVDSGKAIVEEDVVRRIDDMGAAQPIGVLFRHHAAVYFLHRDEPQFDEWLANLRESQSRGSKIRFTYRSIGQRLTSVTRAKE